MGDKPSVEANSFQSDIDDHNLCQFVPVNQQHVVQTAAGNADTSFTDRALSDFGDTGDTVESTQADFVVNGVWLNCYASPSLSERLASSPKRRMKQSKSANHNMNGDTTVEPCRDGKRSLSMEGTLTSTDDHPANSSVAVVDNCMPSSPNEATANSSAPVEPPSPSSSSTVTVVSVVHADSEGKRQQSG